MLRDDEAHYLCSHQVDRAGLKKAQEIVKNGYVAEWIVDNLPGATSFVTADKSRKYYAAGFKLGYEETDLLTGQPRYFLNNHVTIAIRYHRAPGRDGRRGKKVIVGFEVYAKSIEAENRDAGGLPADLAHPTGGMELTMARNATNATTSGLYARSEVDDGAEDATLTIPYTYSVYFREEEHIEWANRWDLYFVNQEDSARVHWLGIVNSLIISGLLTAVVAVILARTIHGDIKGYKDGALEDGKLKLSRRSRSKGPRTPRRSFEKTGLLDPVNGDPTPGADDLGSDDESVPEDITGWKLVHADVFRSPAYGLLLAPLVGSGMQLVFVAGGLIALSCFGVLNPSFRGGFISVGLTLFVVAGIFSGYFSARIYKTFGGSQWRANAVVTATLFPGLLSATILLLNLFVWARGSSGAVPFTTMLVLVGIWFVITVPLSIAGSWLGFKQPQAEPPVRTNQIPRQIPPASGYLRIVPSILLVGILPFLSIFIELYFILNSLWSNRIYYMFGFLFLSFGLLIVTSAAVTIIMIYFVLCAENYHWQWRAFASSGASAIYVFAYSLIYWARMLSFSSFTGGLLYLGYSIMISGLWFVMSGKSGPFLRQASRTC